MSLGKIRELKEDAEPKRDAEWRETVIVGRTLITIQNY